MPNNLTNLKNELNILKTKLEKLPSLSQISSKDFSMYQDLISKKEGLESKISKMLDSQAKIIQTYAQNNENWLYNDKMSCKKYCKLEQKAAYIRDKSLYKIGITDSKPTSPAIQNLKNFFNNKIAEPFSENISPKLSSIKRKLSSFLSSTIQKSPICNQIIKTKDFFSDTLPVKATNLAIMGTKKCIIGYKTFSDSIQGFTRNISSLPVIQVLSYINEQAKKEADLESNSFKSRIKVNINPQYNIPYNNNSYNTNSYINPLSNQDYDLVL